MVSIDELLAILQVKYVRTPLNERKYESPNVERCWELLSKSSRSFVAVIGELHPELRTAMMIFYLILRGLDTIEDDTGLDPAFKIPLLRRFKREVLTTRTWTFNDSSPTEKDRIVLQEFNVILEVFHKLRPEYQDIIADITDKMGNGMADFITKESSKNYEGVKTIEDYDLYCHHVAGIVGEGISRMAVFAKFASPQVAERSELFESMGLFLQKTNIIRDYREDIDEGRSFWPKEVWGKYAKNLEDFKTDKVKGKECVSELLLLSLRHVTDCLDYLANIHEPSLFRFCAIPQVMSIATLELVFNNASVFDKNVKISKGFACQLILAATEMAPVYGIFHDMVTRIHQKNHPADPNYFAIEQRCSKIIQYINTHDEKSNAALRRQEIMHPESKKSIFGFLKLKEEEIEGAKVMAFCTAICLSIMAIMMGVSAMFGAQYPNPWKVLRGQIPLPNRVEL